MIAWCTYTVRTKCSAPGHPPGLLLPGSPKKSDFEDSIGKELISMISVIFNDLDDCVVHLHSPDKVLCPKTASRTLASRFLVSFRQPRSLLCFPRGDSRLQVLTAQGAAGNMRRGRGCRRRPRPGRARLWRSSLVRRRGPRRNCYLLRGIVSVFFPSFNP